MSHKTPARGLRKDIQGLRALAVLVVVANHLLNWPSGGFVGVDIFFVISGFLITDLMLRERDRTGRISYLAFYRRRFRRIIPASVLVLVATVAMSYYIYLPVRAAIVRTDAIWSFFFMSNWHFAAVGTDYFNNENLTSPLQHFWSLAVEEQYYLVWPIVVIGLGLLASRWIPHRKVLVGVLVLVIVTSFAFAMWESSSEPTRAYFSTFSRAWELGIGALLAVAGRRLSRIPVVLQPVFSWLGLAGILLSLVSIKPDSTFPAPWAALPVLSTALVIVAGMGGSGHLLFPLTNPASQYIGNVSYSLYLWHFPVIVLMTAYYPAASPFRTIGILAVMATVTVVGFHFVEDPIRRSTWLEPRLSRSHRVRYRDSFEPQVMRRLGYTGLAVASVAILTFSAYVALSSPAAVADSADLVPAATTTGSDPGGVSDQPVLATPTTRIGPLTFADKPADAIGVAVRAPVFPTLSPSVNDLPDNKAPQWTTNGCGTTGAWNASQCVYGSKNGAKTVAVLGDSIALSWLPGLILALGQHGYQVNSFVAGQCPAADVQVAQKGEKTVNQQCIEHRQWALAAIKALKPDVVVISDSHGLMKTLVSNATGTALVSEWTSAATRTLAALPPSSKTYVLAPPPGSPDLVSCLTVRAVPDNCAKSLTADSSYLAMQQAEKAAVAKSGATFVDTSSWFCAANGRCPSFVGTTPIYVDGVHLTRQFSAYLSPMLEQALKL